MIRKTTQLKQLLNSEQLEFLMEAHNGLSAKIVGGSRIFGNLGERTLHFCCVRCSRQQRSQLDAGS